MRLIRANWSAPTHVHALTTTRLGGHSRAPFNGLNLGDHVNDDPSAVSANRQQLVHALGLTQTPQWLNQVHGTDVLKLIGTHSQSESLDSTPIADASFTQVPGLACAIMTADCLPVLFTNKQGTRVAAAHAGWRGLAAGVLEQTLKQFNKDDQIIAWLGPAIGPLAFEVGVEVKQAFTQMHPKSEVAFKPSPTHPDDRFLADLYMLARIRLEAAGVSEITGGEHCTFSDEENFFSYRRDNLSGRMASLIWIEPA